MAFDVATFARASAASRRREPTTSSGHTLRREPLTVSSAFEGSSSNTLVLLPAANTSSSTALSNPTGVAEPYIRFPGRVNLGPENNWRAAYEGSGRGVRNSDPLTRQQVAQVLRAARELGIAEHEIAIYSGNTQGTAYSEVLDTIFVGPNIFPANPSIPRRGRTVLERMTPRVVLAHELGHRTTTRNGTAHEPGSVADEVQASLVGRTLPQLNYAERFQLLRDAEERARAEGTTVRELLRTTLCVTDCMR